jgi:hypothetical protein
LRCRFSHLPSNADSRTISGGDSGFILTQPAKSVQWKMWKEYVKMLHPVIYFDALIYYNHNDSGCCRTFAPRGLIFVPQTSPTIPYEVTNHAQL